MEKITQIVEDNGGYITVSEASDSALYQRLVRAVERGVLVRLRNGVYALPTSLINTMIDVERIVPKGVVCLYSAWMHYQLTMEVQPAFCIAIDAKRKIALPEDTMIRLYYWQPKNFEFGIVDAEISGYRVRITDIERSVCDAIKYRNKIGIDTCTEILRNYLARPDRNITKLNDYASRLRVSNTLNQYVSTLLLQ